MNGATVMAQLTIASAPETRTGRRSSDPPGKSRTFAFATARAGDDPLVWRIFGFTPTARATIGRLRIGDLVTARGRLAVQVVNGAPVVALDCASARTPKQKAPRRSGRRGGTPMADPARVQAANEAFYRKNGISP